MILKSFASIALWAPGPAMRKLGLDMDKEVEKEYFSALSEERYENQLFEESQFWLSHVQYVR